MSKSLLKILRRDAVVLKSTAMEGVYFEDMRPIMLGAETK